MLNRQPAGTASALSAAPEITPQADLPQYRIERQPPTDFQPALPLLLIKIGPAVQIRRLDAQLGQDHHDLGAVLGGMVDRLCQ